MRAPESNEPCSCEDEHDDIREVPLDAPLVGYADICNRCGGLVCTTTIMLNQPQERDPEEKMLHVADFRRVCDERDAARAEVERLRARQRDAEQDENP